MPTPVPPIVQQDPYPRKLFGAYGQMGGSGEVRAHYLLTTVNVKDLRSISLVHELEGSQKWEVRDLYQREIDATRVELSIMPYLEDLTKVKFFNPLTLTLLPMTESGHHIKKTLSYVEGVPITEAGVRYTLYELEGYFRLLVNAQPQFSRIEINDQKMKLVAIDGQHRLSALRRIYAKGESSPVHDQITQWAIPVGIIIPLKTSEMSGGSNLLQIIRSLFIYINKEAKKPSRAREIILDEESIPAICTQEILQHSHTNDINTTAENGPEHPERLPLAFFEWRGAEKWNARLQRAIEDPSPTYITKIEEVHEWLDYFILSDPQKALVLQDMEPPIVLNENEKLSIAEATRVRERFRDRVMPGICYLLEHFVPYEMYIEQFRKVEQEYRYGESDLKKCVFDNLLYGGTKAPVSADKVVNEAYIKLVDTIDKIKRGSSGLTQLLREDIGMRGVIFAFTSNRIVSLDIKKRTVPWLEYAEWFTEALNKVYKLGWLDDESMGGSKKEISEMYIHITKDPRGRRINYRLDHIDNGIGCVVEIMTLLHAHGVSKSKVLSIWQNRADELRTTLKRGYKSEMRADAIEKYGARSYAKPLSRDAEAAAARHLEQKLAPTLGLT